MDRPEAYPTKTVSSKIRDSAVKITSKTTSSRNQIMFSPPSGFQCAAGRMGSQARLMTKSPICTRRYHWTGRRVDKR